MWRSRTLLPRWTRRLTDAIEALAWRGGRIIAMPIDGNLLVAASDGAILRQPTGHAGGNLSLAVAPDDHAFATSGQDGRFRIHGLDGTESAGKRAGEGWIDPIAWSSRQEIATACKRSVTRWSTELTVRQILEGFPSTVTHLAYAPDGETLAISHYGGVTLIDAEGNRRLLEWKGSQLHLAWSHDGRWLAAATQDRALHLWRIPMGEDCEISGFSAKVQAIAWHPRELRVACTGGPSILIWDCGGTGPEGRAPEEFTWHGNDVTAVAWHPGGKFLASADRDGRIGIWTPGDKKAATSWQAPAGITRLAWDAHGNQLAIGCSDGTLAIFAE
jgi:WD40 repeat protein